MTIGDPFHEGERYVQERTGERGVALRNGAILGDTIPSRAIPFLAQQHMLVVGSADADGAVWASVLMGTPGLASSTDGRSVVIDRTRIDGGDDPSWHDLRAGRDIGLLAIDLGSRRRLRINGVVRDVDAHRVEVTVREAYPNCPKYIQRRVLRADPGAVPDDASDTSGVALDPARALLVGRTDTLFVASRHAERGVDVSHRGGAPGFVRLLDATRLRIPDYPGNSMFNTFGNLAVDDRAGLAILDFDRGWLLQLTGTAVLHFDEADDPRQPTGGSGRYWDFLVMRWHERSIGRRLAWELLEASPHNPRPLT